PPPSHRSGSPPMIRVQPQDVVVASHPDREMEVHYITVVSALSMICTSERAASRLVSGCSRRFANGLGLALLRGGRLLQFAHFALEIGEVVEPLVDRREAQIGDGIGGP